MNPRAQRANNPLLTGDPTDPRFDPPTQEEQDYYRDLGYWQARADALGIPPEVLREIFEDAA